MLRALLAAAICLALSACSPAPETRGVDTRTIRGKVVERLDGPPYSYLRVRGEQSEVWVAVPIAGPPVGNAVEVVNGVVLRGFEARAIGKRFDSIVFGTIRQR